VIQEVTLIYDGACQLCIRSVNWVKKELAVTALDFHTTDLSKFGLTKQECAKQVYVIQGGVKLAGADAVSHLLKLRGNKVLSYLLKSSGPVGRAAYFWVANHRSSPVVKMLFKLIGI
jgi:predicted DCC family thiol-disulfide oxidoreductase YuxK